MHLRQNAFPHIISKISQNKSVSQRGGLFPPRLYTRWRKAKEKIKQEWTLIFFVRKPCRHQLTISSRVLTTIFLSFIFQRLWRIRNTLNKNTTSRSQTKFHLRKTIFVLATLTKDDFHRRLLRINYGK